MPSNPFATKFISPGKLPFLFPDEHSIGSLIDRLATCKFQAQIVGPHGSGKSTLLAELLKKLANQFEIHQLDPKLLAKSNAIPATLHASNLPGMIVIDGFEQISRKLQNDLKRFANHADAGLLVTLHKPVDLPLLYETKPAIETFERLVQHILEANHGDLSFDSQTVADIFQSHQGDIREALFSLYDLYEI